MNTEDTDAVLKILFTFDLKTSTVQAWFKELTWLWEIAFGHSPYINNNGDDSGSSNLAMR